MLWLPSIKVGVRLSWLSCFQLLKQAYVDARYSEHYKISQDELEWLADRVKHLQQLTETLCQEKIASFE